MQLFARTSKSVALTNAGEVLLVEARRLLLQAAEAERLTVRSASGLAGRLRIGFVSASAGTIDRLTHVIQKEITLASHFANKSCLLAQSLRMKSDKYEDASK